MMITGTIKGTWKHLENLLKARTQEMYARDINLIDRVQLTLEYLLSKVWQCSDCRYHRDRRVKSRHFCGLHGMEIQFVSQPIYCIVPKKKVGRAHTLYAKCMPIHKQFTYSAGKEMVTVVWVATQRRHRQMENTLNKCTLAPALEFLRTKLQRSVYLALDRSHKRLRLIKRRVCRTMP